MVTRRIIEDNSHWLKSPLVEKAQYMSMPALLAEGVGIAEILNELGMDKEGLAASIIYPSLKIQEIDLDTVAEHFGEKSAKLLRDVLQMSKLNKLQSLSKRPSHQLENLRKMLLAMVADVRAVLLVLAERLWQLRQTPSIDFAQQTLDIYAPLANRLGVGTLKWEMEDLCLRYIQPETYKKIAAWLASRRTEREAYIQQVMQALNQALEQGQIKHAQVTGRVKHIYSIYRKMLRKKGDLNEIYDISAVRVLVDDLSQCYSVLGIVHEKWTQIPKEFDDYIANPKPNGYQSIHTAVLGPENRTLEVQIRTHQMHQNSELGVAAHWRYKEGGAQKSDYEAKIAWLREVMAWQKEISQTHQLQDNSNIPSEKSPEKKFPEKDLFADRVYVFTPAGDIVDLAKGSTPLDFAYHIHSEVGHRCKGAKIDGHIVPLTYHLQMGERIEILTSKQPKPSRDWMNPHTGYLKTPRARSKVQHWFRVFDEMSSSALESNAINIKEKEKSLPVMPELPTLKKASKKSHYDIQILGVDNLLTQIAGCCKPLPGEDIIGYITLGNGVSIHKKCCKNILHIYQTNGKVRLIEVAWGEKIADIYPVDIKLEAYDRHGLLRDVTAYFASEKINMLGLQTYTDKKTQEAHIKLTIEIITIAKLQPILTHLKQIPNMINVYRLQEH